MKREVHTAIYDRLFPRWQNAPVKGGEWLVKCPFHADGHPILRLNEDDLTATATPGLSAAA